MSPELARKLLENVANGRKTVNEALADLATLPFDHLGRALLDHHRELRTAVPETIYGASKTPGQIIDILKRMRSANGKALATRVSPDAAAEILKEIPDAVYDATSRLVLLGKVPEVVQGAPRALVMCAGTSDLPVAEEAAQTLEFLGHGVDRLVDVGVAGIHRLLAKLDDLRAADVIIAVAGMEGALPSVVGGLADGPVIGVPTSVGYGVGAGGNTALFSMLTSCATGIAVVNIDNGHGAAILAHQILRRLKPKSAINPSVPTP